MPILELNVVVEQPFKRKHMINSKNFMQAPFTYNAAIKRHKIVGYNVNGVKQPTVFFPFEVLVIC